MKGLVIALQFLTSLPLGKAKTLSREEMGSSLSYFPLVGLILGGFLVLIDYVASLLWPPLVTSAILVIALILLTGGLHLDGLIDTCDGLFSLGSKEERLAIMRDSRVGSFGAIGAASLILLKFALLTALPLTLKSRVLFLMPMLGRWAMVFAITKFPSARQGEGMGRLFINSGGRRELIISTLVVLFLSLILLKVRGVVYFLGIWLVSWLIMARITRELGGLTGDIYGALEEFMEVTYLAFASLRSL